MEVAEAPQPLFKKRGPKKSNIRKRTATLPVASSDSSDYSSDDGENGHRIKRRRKVVGVTTTSASITKVSRDDLEAPKFAADRSAHIDSTNDATKQSNWFDEAKNGEMSAQNLLGSTRPRPGPDEKDDGIYKGSSNYQSFIQKNPNAQSKQVGPVKAPTNIRTITVTDFAPDVCKDYKQTGFCGFGDSCKFLHAREDYKQGWQLDKDWETVTKGKKIVGKTMSSRNKEADDGSGDEDAILEGIPFACIICKKPYTYPIVTKCGHYFCEACALQRYRKTPACAACGAGTGGVFNGAKNLRKLLEKKKERAKNKREKAVENGEEVSEAEEENDNQD
ncbi:RNA-splicing factor [Ptychographa xylographoides]|nr:RNA-splicing factor [Ptychographa xylographoides]